MRQNIRTVSYGLETISYRGPKTWALVPDKIKNSTNLLELKTKIKQWKPQGCSCRLCKVYLTCILFYSKLLATFIYIFLLVDFN